MNESARRILSDSGRLNDIWKMGCGTWRLHGNILSSAEEKVEKSLEFIGTSSVVEFLQVASCDNENVDGKILRFVFVMWCSLCMIRY